MLRGSEAEGKWALSGWTRPVTVLLVRCTRLEKVNSVDSRDRIVLRDLPECPRIIIINVDKHTIFGGYGPGSAQGCFYCVFHRRETC